ncbi:MAG: glycoside hydrolase family 15 protein [Acidobacteriaceae bacterium]|nr:glycoside hydrolase family 15 protein [Acidobacteriaceae bacterium]
MFGFGRKHTQDAPHLHGARIEDYAIIGDLQTAALVSKQGSIDWLCWPTFSSPACFASLLGTADNGFWKVYPLCGENEPVVASRRYVPCTNILESTFRTKDGEVCVTDFMPPRGKYSDIIRIVTGVRGKVKMRMDLKIRFDYGLTVPWVTMHNHELRAVAGPNMVVLRAVCDRGVTATLRGDDDTMATVSEFTVREGDRVCFAMTYAPSTDELPPAIHIDKELQDTKNFWEKWIAPLKYEGIYREQVERSLVTLKSLTYEPTGGMVAAVTTSLPEQIGGGRNWDYRYCWLRDTAFTLLTLLNAGFTEEAMSWRKWLLRAVAGSPEQLQVLYSIHGERRLEETSLSWLPGYENSSPVRVGNAASGQFQLDVFGEVVLAMSRLPDAVDDLRTPSNDVMASIVDRVCKVWDQPDEGIWEVRSGRQHFVHSKAMAWLALDLAIEHHERYDGKGDVKRWRKNRDMLHKEICERGFNKRLNSFTQTYDGDTIDASLLRLAFIRFLPLDDPRIIGTVHAVENTLMRDGLVERYDTSRSPDGLSGSEGTFLACSFWLVTGLCLIGESEKARPLFERLLALCNDLGLLSEEYDPRAKRMLGNFPQALSHIALVHAAFTLSGKWAPRMVREGVLK